MVEKSSRQATPGSSFNMDWGTDVDSLMPQITDFSSAIGSWGQSKAGGGIGFKTPSADIPPTSFAGLNPETGGDSWRMKLLGGKDSQGNFVNGSLPTGISALTGLAGAYLGWQQFNLAKDQLAQNKKIFNLNFGNQAKMVNTQLEDRQRARVAGGGGAYESVDSYMAKNAVQTKGI